MKKEVKVIDFTEARIKQFIESIRPPEDVRDQLDIGFNYENNSLEVVEIRPRWDDENQKNQMPVAKAKYVKSRTCWKVYWMRASGDWESYAPHPEVKDVSEFFEILDADEHACFWG